MSHDSTLLIPGSSSDAQQTPSSPGFRPKSRRLWTLPGLTGPVLLVRTPVAKPGRKSSLTRDFASLLADVFQIREWRGMDPVGCLLLAAYAAVIAQPLVFGNLGSTIVALMTPVK